MYYKICEHCGAHLDPNETCDCQWMDDPEMDMCQSRRKIPVGRYEMDSYAREDPDYEHAYA